LLPERVSAGTVLGDITGPVLLAVLLGALLHASWNALIKSSQDKTLDTALIHSLGTVLALPMLALFGLPPVQAWPYILASTTIHIGYYVSLAGAYRHGDLGLTYPLMRGSAPLLVALASHALIGETLSPAAWAGVATVSAGVLLLGLSRHRLQAGGPVDEAQRRKALRFALGNAGFIAAYTIVDGLGVRASGDAMSYVAALFLFDGLPYLMLVLWQRRTDLATVRTYMLRRWPIAAVGTLASIGSYGIALWAMTRAPVATVAALRETSVLFAALLGAWLLREPFGWQRGIGTLVIVAGVMSLRFS
jgi:phosphonate utilization associated putative membrane protein